VWFEVHETLEGALIRERQIKKWKRDWKINLIEQDNPHWVDLYDSLCLNRWEHARREHGSLPSQGPARVPRGFRAIMHLT